MKLANTDARTAPTTTSGHRMIAKPAKGKHIVSRKGPSRPIRSCKRQFHPLKSHVRAFTNSNSRYHYMSIVIPIIAAIIAPRRYCILHQNMELHEPCVYQFRRPFMTIIFFHELPKFCQCSSLVESLVKSRMDQTYN